MTASVRRVTVLAGALLVAAAVVFRLGAGTSSAAVSSTLHAEVGPGLQISLTYDDGTPVVSPPAGTYTVQVSDVAGDHNFHLAGPGVDLATPIDTLQTTTWTVTLRNNSRYVFQCDAHPDSMSGKFEVGTPPPEPGGGAAGGSGGSSAKAGLATIKASLDARGALRVTVDGAKLSSLRPGGYRFVVADASRKDGVTLRRAGAAATPLTGGAYAGSRTISKTLTAGTWTLYPSSRAASSIVLRVKK